MMGNKCPNRPTEIKRQAVWDALMGKGRKQTLTVADVIRGNEMFNGESVIEIPKQEVEEIITAYETYVIPHSLAAE